jgi:DNA-directed RNA polymerase specialized sigma24 family protein
MKAPWTPKNAQVYELNSPWLVAAHRQDLKTYNRMVMDYQDQVYSFAYYVLCNQTGAVQAMQQAFTLSYQKVSKYRRGTLLFWLLQNLVEVCQDRLKSRLDIPGDSDQSLPMAALPPELRLLIALVDMEGLDYHQAAQITGRSLRQISRSVAQARQQLCHSPNL